MIKDEFHLCQSAARRRREAGSSQLIIPAASPLPSSPHPSTGRLEMWWGFSAQGSEVQGHWEVAAGPRTGHQVVDVDLLFKVRAGLRFMVILQLSPYPSVARSTLKESDLKCQKPGVGSATGSEGERGLVAQRGGSVCMCVYMYMCLCVCVLTPPACVFGTCVCCLRPPSWLFLCRVKLHLKP